MSPRPPIVLFAFNRPDHLARSLAALGRCRGAGDSDLLVFLDGPRNPGEEGSCQQVAAVAEAAQGFRSVSVTRAASNQGLFRAVTGGVNEALRRHKSIIVVEDDLVVDEAFLDYMSGELARYEDQARAGCIHGYALPIPGLPEFYFLRGGDCWGWATWQDRWALFEPNPVRLLKALVSRGKLMEFMSSHGAGSLMMLCRRARGRNQSWAILWHASLFLADRLTLHPGRSFVTNIGNDGSGTHASSTQRYHSTGSATAPLPSAAIALVQDEGAARAVSCFMDGRDGGLLDAVIIGLKRRCAALYARWTLWQLEHRRDAPGAAE